MQMNSLTVSRLLPIEGLPIRNAYIRWNDQGIFDLGSVSDAPESLRSVLSEPIAGSILTPGFVNLHTHLEQSFPSPIPNTRDQPFTDWLLAVVALNRKHSSPQEKRSRSEAGVRELLETGTTCTNDIASGSESAEAMFAAGLRGRVALECFYPGHQLPIQTASIIQAYSMFCQSLLPFASLILPALSPHSLYNVSLPALESLIAGSKPEFLHLHVSEFADEVAYLRGEPSEIPTFHQHLLGKTFTAASNHSSSIQALLKTDALTIPTVLAHCALADAVDIKNLSGTRAAVAHCPRSNLALHGQTLNGSDWANSTVPIGLGTDGRLSTPDLDLRAEARTAMSLHGWSATETLRRMTFIGAKALGLADEIGSLTLGKAADFVLWKTDLPVDTLSADAVAAYVLSERTSVQGVWTQGIQRI